jgi:hypothetical protein
MSTNIHIDEIPNPNAIDLKPPKFNCDSPLGKHIVKPFPDCYSFIVLVGAARSGKTSCLINMFREKNIYNRVFDHVIIVIPVHSLQSMSDNIFEDLPEEQKYHELDIETMDSILDQVRTWADNGESTCVIMDDVVTSLKNNRIQKALGNLIALQ